MPVLRNSMTHMSQQEVRLCCTMLSLKDITSNIQCYAQVDNDDLSVLTCFNNVIVTYHQALPDPLVTYHDLPLLSDLPAIAAFTNCDLNCSEQGFGTSDCRAIFVLKGSRALKTE